MENRWGFATYYMRCMLPFGDRFYNEKSGG